MNWLLYFIVLSCTTINFCNPGSLDTSFNQSGEGGTTPGTVVLNLSDQTEPSGTIYSTAKAVTIQTDGKIVTSGYGTYGSEKQLTVARFLSNGTLDASFNANETPGYITFQISGASESVANDIALDTASGNIVITGYAIITGAYKAFIARFIGGNGATAGTLDTSFNTTGTQPGIATYLIPSSSYGCNPKALYIQSDSNIVITGEFNASMGIFIARILGTGQNAGALDTTNFGSGLGYATLFTGINSSSYAIELQTLTDKYIITGYTTVNSTQQIFIARYLTTGLLDNSTFNPTTPYGVADNTGNAPGYSITTIAGGAQAFGLAMKGNGTALVAGYNISGSLFPKPIVLAQFTPNGQFDTNFNGDGIVLTQITGDEAYNFAIATGVTINFNGQIITTGFTSATTTTDTFFARYNANGSLDTTFTEKGYIIPTINNGTISDSITTDPDGKIITAGYSNVNGFSEMIVIRAIGGSLENQSTITIADYGYNSLFIASFLYQDFYTKIITDLTVQQATLDAINNVVDTYISDYSEQPNFNYITYLYLLLTNLLTTQADLINLYPTSADEINSCFNYINSRILQLIEPN